jgi:alkaline phosphatase/alkaline phosphatase D
MHHSGFEEFSCGALNRENARLGRNPGDPKSSDPDAKIRQPYTDPSAIGGFLRVSLTPAGPKGPATLEFILHDDTGKSINFCRAP